MTASRSFSGRITSRSGIVFVALAMSLATTTPAWAGDGAAAAEVLFTEGKRLVSEGDYAHACPKFEESQKLDPGMGTLYRLADCYEHIGRTASAWAAFLEVAGSAKTSGQQARADDAKKRASELEPNLPRLQIHVAEPDLAGLVVKRGDVEVGRGQWDTPLPVDPGEVKIEAAAPGRTTWRGTAIAVAKGVGKVDVPALAVAPMTPVTLGGRTGRTPSSFGPQRIAAVAVGAAGVVALGVGAVFGLVSMSKKGDADKLCDANNVCEQAGLDLRSDALSAGNIATVGFVAGGVLAAAGVVLWVTAPSRAATTGGRPTWRAGLAPRWAGLSLNVELP